MNTRQVSIFLARIALFVIYFWFGLLKVFGVSPASPLVTELFSKTLSHIPLISSLSPDTFVVLFGLFEIVIGILFIIPKQEKVAFVLFVLHMITTTLPLFVVSSVWTGFLVPTLEGQYIVKNLALIACALLVASVHTKDSDFQTNIA